MHAIKLTFCPSACMQIWFALLSQKHYPMCTEGIYFASVLFQLHQ